MSASNEQLKQAVREVLSEWLDRKYAAVGRWTVSGLAAGAFAGVVALIVWAKAHQ